MQNIECRMQNEKRLRPRSRAWIWFFVVLIAMSAAAVALPIVYNLSIQLRPEELTAARALEGERPARLRSAIRGKDHAERRADGIDLAGGGARRPTDGGDARRPEAARRGLPEPDGGRTVCGDRKGFTIGPGGGRGATTRRRRSTCATAIRRTTSGGCAAAATGWRGTSICSSRARGRGGDLTFRVPCFRGQSQAAPTGRKAGGPRKHVCRGHFRQGATCFRGLSCRRRQGLSRKGRESMAPGVYVDEVYIYPLPLPVPVEPTP